MRHRTDDQCSGPTEKDAGSTPPTCIPLRDYRVIVTKTEGFGSRRRTVRVEYVPTGETVWSGLTYPENHDEMLWQAGRSIRNHQVYQEAPEVEVLDVFEAEHPGIPLELRPVR